MNNMEYSFFFKIFISLQGALGELALKVGSVRRPTYTFRAHWSAKSICDGIF